MQINHFAAMALFALFISIAFAALQRESFSGSVRRAALSFLMFMACAIALAWLFLPLSR